MRSQLLLFASIALAVPTAPLAAKESLGVFGKWGAFRDAGKARCYAIAKPNGNGHAGAFASIANWPGLKIRGQLHIRLTRPAPAGAAVTLRIGNRSFPLAARGRDAWAVDARSDAAIIAAIRSANRMTVRTRGVSDRYELDGVATAIDAAIVGCVTR